jgi:hypothetical protein
VTIAGDVRARVKDINFTPGTRQLMSDDRTGKSSPDNSNSFQVNTIRVVMSGQARKYSLHMRVSSLICILRQYLRIGASWV